MQRLNPRPGSSPSARHPPFSWWFLSLWVLGFAAGGAMTGCRPGGSLDAGDLEIGDLLSPDASDGASIAAATVLVGPTGALIYEPMVITISVGQTVAWVWSSSGHDVVSGAPPGAPDGRFCSPGDVDCAHAAPSRVGFRYLHRFDTAGDFPYFCSLHVGSEMVAEIVVR